VGRDLENLLLLRRIDFLRPAGVKRSPSLNGDGKDKSWKLGGKNFFKSFIYKQVTYYAGDLIEM
jgi:hypothetical protein